MFGAIHNELAPQAGLHPEPLKCRHWNTELALSLMELYPDMVEHGYSLSMISKLMVNREREITITSEELLNIIQAQCGQC
jgi:hypothetical protein